MLEALLATQLASTVGDLDMNENNKKGDMTMVKELKNKITIDQWRRGDKAVLVHQNCQPSGASHK